METQEIFEKFRDKFYVCKDIGYSEIEKCRQCGTPLYFFHAYSGIGISRVGVCPICGHEVNFGTEEKES